MPTSPPPDDHDDLLSELASLTGLFNPENIWKEEEQLDALDEQEANQANEVPPTTE